MKIIETHLVFKGRVQGVGFRYMTVQFAEKIGLKGTVCNLPDGTVEVKVQGTCEMIEELIQSLKLHFGENISEIKLIKEKKPAKFFESFKIIH